MTSASNAAAVGADRSRPGPLSSWIARHRGRPASAGSVRFRFAFATVHLHADAHEEEKTPGGGPPVVAAFGDQPSRGVR